MGLCLLKPVEIGPSESGEGLVEGKTIKYASNKSRGRRQYMEDTVVVTFCGKGSVLENTCFAGVFDGHGGSKVAEFARDNLVSYLETGLKQTDYTAIADVDTDILETTISDVFLDIDDKIGSLPAVLVREAPGCLCLKPYEYLRDIDNVGSTATACLVTPEKLVFANCGDSRTILIRNNEVAFATTDHTPEDVGEAARIENAGGFVEGNRVDGILGVARSLGDHRFKMNEDLPPEMQEVSAVPEVTTLDRSKDDQFVVLASDGLWGVMNNEQVRDFVLKSIVDKKQTIDECCEALLAYACNKLYSGDNISVVIVAL